MKGYKVFEPDWTCRGFQYEVGKTYKMDATPKCCVKGFHFCERLIDCFECYPFNENNKVAEVEAIGVVDSGWHKLCTNELKIVREITWKEVLNAVNLGRNCTGYMNCSDDNNGNYNSGYHNIGGGNSGSRNSGNWNSGRYNRGDCNSGSSNSGNHNSGCLNNGNYNSGSHNSGNRNSGRCNNGNWNSGHNNNGNRNSGDWNKTSCSSGCFNTKEEKIIMFNKPSNWTLNDWRRSRAYYLMRCIEDTRGIELTQEWWNNLSEKDKNCIMSLPNFDADIFEEITGIKVDNAADDLIYIPSQNLQTL